MSAEHENVPMGARLNFNRKLLVFAHSVTAFASILVYLSRVDFGGFQYWRRGVSLLVIFIAAPPLIPYIISGVHSYQLVTYRRSGVWLFLGVIVVGTLLMGLLLTGAFDVNIDALTIVIALIAQAIVYFWSAEFLLSDHSA